MKALEVVLWFKTARFARFFEEDAVDNQGKQGLRVCILTGLNRCVLIERQYGNTAVMALERVVVVWGPSLAGRFDLFFGRDCVGGKTELNKSGSARISGSTPEGAVGICIPSNFTHYWIELGHIVNDPEGLNA